MAGPFMDEASGGMVISEPGISLEEIEQFAAADPTVQSGLLVYAIRSGLPGLHK